MNTGEWAQMAQDDAPPDERNAAWWDACVINEVPLDSLEALLVTQPLRHLSHILGFNN